MSNIFKIISSDIKRLSTNVVAIVVIMGLTVLPCVYAWFNILSNWDPYGAESTSHLQVAVASADEGIVVGGVELNVGDKIVSNLKENTTIGWVFPDTVEEAIDGVHSGDYYAALVIEEEFSKNMVSFLGGDITNPKITYYENEKKNAIAPKITSKVKTTVQREVDQAFVSTIASVLLEASEMLVQIDDDGNLAGAAVTKLESLDSDLKAVILILDSYISLMDSTEELMAAGEAVADEVDSMMVSATAMANSADAAADAASTTVRSMSSLIDTQLAIVDSEMEYINTLLDSNLSVSDYSYIGDLAKLASRMGSTAAEAWSKVDTSELADYDCQAEIQDITNNLTYLNDNLDYLQDAAATTDEHVNDILNTTKTNVANCRHDVEAIKKAYSNNVEPQLDNTLGNVQSTITEIESLLNYRTSSIDLVAKSLSSYPNMMNQSKDSLEKSKKEAQEMEEQLSKLIDDMQNMQDNDQYDMVVELIESDPDFLADFIASPVKLSEQYVYPVENNGSATAPFYVVLSIWVGSLMMSTILKTPIKDKSEYKNLKNWQCFFGRYFVTFVLGQTQTLLTVLGALFYVGIQCEHKFLFWLVCAWTSFVFSLLLYSFTYSFGNVGEALSVILMVIQVAGSGGTFPIEVLPKVFQYLYAAMPFKYAMNACRECIAGFYNNDYWKYFFMLIIFVGVACINGLLLYFPMIRLNEQIERSKEKSGILL